MTMTRNKTFKPDREPLRKNNALQLDTDEIHGPVSFLNPTQARFDAVISEKPTLSGVASEAEQGPSSDDESPANIAFKWTSRDNRKGRHALVVQPDQSGGKPMRTPPPTNSLQEVMKGILRMFIFFPVWDISYMVAIVFTFGSAVWMMNAFLILFPITTVEEMSVREVLFTAGITPFVATTTFVLGSVLLMIEAFNENREGCFGWAVERLYDPDNRENNAEPESVARIVPSKDECTHHHQNVLNLVGRPSRTARIKELKKSVTTASAYPESETNRKWVWLPSWHELRTHYIRELSFLACSVQLVGILAYWISSIVVLPRIDRALSDSSQLDPIYWS